jgi:hypothetical protein
MPGVNHRNPRETSEIYVIKEGHTKKFRDWNVWMNTGGLTIEIPEKLVKFT